VEDRPLPDQLYQVPKKDKYRGKLRWWIVWTLFLSTVTNYLSRQTFSVLSPMITAEFHLSHVELSRILGTFQIAYAITWLLGGVILDRVGTRWGLAIAAAWWSLVNIFTGFAHSVFSFSIFRFMLGMGEGFNWPGASKAVAEWFPAEERGLAVAIFDSGSSVGGALAALIIPWIAIAFGWRWSFVFSGVLGLLWLIPWLRLYHPVESHPEVSAAEVALIQRGRTAVPATGKQGPRQWLALAKSPKVWGIVLGRSLTDPIWWFYVFWLPQYLSDARGFSLKRIALFAWMPFVAADLGNFTGGYFSGVFIRRGFSVVRSRLWVCVMSCVPILAGIPIAGIHNVYLALALICIALWGYASWSTMGLTLPSDLIPQESVATVTGLSGFSAGLAGAAFTFAVGMLVDRFSYAPVFAVAGLLPLFATASLFLLIREDA
jgi:ACS family hexuronate transporter-like MFS transporter